LDNVKLSGWSASGVLFQPVGPGKLVVSNSLFARNGTGATGAGIRVFPRGAQGTAQVNITHSDFSGNVFGLAGDGTGGNGGGINIVISDSSLGGNTQDGIVAVSGIPVAVMADLVRTTQNGGNGIRSIGGNSTVRVGRSTITGNGMGVVGVGGGQILSSGSNFLQANGANGAFTGSFSLN
jgi:hypothetical protein